MNYKFKESVDFTVGFELEVMIVDNINYKPLRKFEEIHNNIDIELKKYFHREFFQSMIEISSPIFYNLHEVIPFFNKITNELIRQKSTIGFEIFALGIHPFLYREDVKLTKNKRYKILYRELQELLRRFIINGLHIHIGLPDKKTAINAFNLTNYYMPLFLAMSASSPFFEGEFTGMHSYRSSIFESLPRGGLPEYIYNYGEFIEVIEILEKTGYIKSYRDIWCDTRLRPDFGTVELRVCDAINSVDRILAIITLMQALCYYAQYRDMCKYNHLICKQNKWNAVRYALDGKFITLNGELKTLREVGFELLDRLNRLDIFQILKTEDYLDNIRKYLTDKTISQNIIEAYRSKKNIRNIINLGFIK
jgi:carboxylate-amine ligase